MDWPRQPKSSYLWDQVPASTMLPLRSYLASVALFLALFLSLSLSASLCPSLFLSLPLSFAISLPAPSFSRPPFLLLRSFLRPPAARPAFSVSPLLSLTFLPLDALSVALVRRLFLCPP